MPIDRLELGVVNLLGQALKYKLTVLECNRARRVAMHQVVRPRRPACEERANLLAHRERRLAGERLVGAYLTIPVAEAETTPDRVLWDEVIGITVRGAAGEVIGEIVDCYRAGGAEVYLVRTPDGAELDLPAVAAVITAFDPRAGMIVADLSAMELGPHRRPAETARRQRPRRGGARNVPRNIGRDGGAGG